MANVSEDINTQRKDGEMVECPVAQGEHIYAGTLVTANADGYAESGTDSSNRTFEGIANEEVDNSDGSAGDKTIKVWREHTWHLDTENPWAFDQGACNGWVYVYDDNSVADDSDVSNNVAAGIVEKVEDDGSVWVNIEPACRKGFDWSMATTTTTSAPTTTT